MDTFFQSSHTPEEYLAKLIEEVGEVAVEHLALMRMKKTNGKRGQKRTANLIAELADVQKVAAAWANSISEGSVK